MQTPKFEMFAPQIPPPAKCIPGRPPSLPLPSATDIALYLHDVLCSRGSTEIRNDMQSRGRFVSAICRTML